VIEHVVQLPGVGAQPVLVADVDRDRAIPAQPGNVLIDERERRVGRPFRQDGLLVVSDRQIEVERRVLRIRRPGRRRRQLRAQPERQLRRVRCGFDRRRVGFWL